jgi:hypothetical protein
MGVGYIEHYTILYRGPEHPQILVSGVLESIPCRYQWMTNYAVM